MSLAVADGVLAVGDGSGNILFRRWPDGPDTVVEAHGDIGPIAAAGRLVVSSGGWDPTVRAWDPVEAVPEWSCRPVDGRVTAVCGDDRRVLVVGADRKRSGRGGSSGTGRGSKDRVHLEPSAVFAVSRTGSVRRVVQATGAIGGLVCGPDWFGFVDQDAGRCLVVVRSGAKAAAPGIEGAVTAVAADGDAVVAATHAGLWRYDVPAGTIARLGTLADDDPEVLALAVADGAIAAATSEGLRRWPGNEPLGPQDEQPVALTGDGETVFVLWRNGRVEQRCPMGEVSASVIVPHQL